jgi:predicted component of type VI protein secretion system
MIDRDAVDLVDQSSTNGAFANGKSLDANVPVRLRDGDAVAFGEVAAKYHTTAAFLHFIEGLL